MQTLLTTTTTTLAAMQRYTKRADQAKFTTSTLVQTLVFGWLAHPDATVEQLAQRAARVGVVVSPQAIDQQFTRRTATRLQQMLLASLPHQIAADPVVLPLFQRFTGIFVQDSTTVVLPHARAADWAGCGATPPRTRRRR